MADVEIETGLLAVLKNGDIVRIVSVNECEIVVEDTNGRSIVSRSQIDRTYLPAEGSGYQYERPAFHDAGIDEMEKRSAEAQ